MSMLKFEPSSLGPFFAIFIQQFKGLLLNVNKMYFN